MTNAATASMSSSHAAMRLWLEFAFAELSAHSLETDTRAIDAATNEDAEDATLAAHGDGDAFERIVRRHQNEIARRLARFTRNPGVLEELVQETFVQAFVSIRKYRGEAPLIHWLHRIAVRAGYRHWKSKQAARHTELVEDLAGSSPRDDNDEEIERVLRALSPRDRLVVTLLYLDGRSIAETARLTGWSKVMVKVQAYRARSKLRKLMLSAGDDR